MTEALVVFGVVALLVVLGVLSVAVPVETLIVIALCCVGVGFVLGLACGTYYHVALYRYLVKYGGVSRAAFLWNPTRYHSWLQPDELRRVMPWFIAGALGFGLVLLGSAIFMLGLLRVA